MAGRGTWVLNPNSGGKPIPESVQRSVDARLCSFAEKHYAGRYSRLDIRFRGQFCYVDAFAEPQEPGPSWPPAGWRETREKYMERVRSTPIRLCRLRYFGDEERWGSGSLAISPPSRRLAELRPRLGLVILPLSERVGDLPMTGRAR